MFYDIEKNKHIGMRVDEETHYKLRYISNYEGRSANGQILYLVRKCIADYEAVHGEIERPDKSSR